MRRPALALLLGCLLLVAGASALDGYDYYQTIEYAACDQETYQQDIVVHRTTGTAYEEVVGGLKIWHIYVGDHCREDYGDVRFTNSTGAELAYYLWPDYSSESARFTVRLEGADQSGALTVWYGNPTATTTSDGDATYEFFDHFDGTAIDSGKWVCWMSGGSQSVSNSAFAISSGSTWYGWGTKAKWNYPYNIRLEMRVKVNSDSNYWNVGFDDRVNGAVGDIDCARVLAHNGWSWQTCRENTASQITRSSSDSFSNWAVARIDLTGDSVKFYRNNALKTTITTNLPRDPLSVEMTVKGRTLYTDYVLVRAYSATPPAATTFSGEQETAAPPVTAFTATPLAGLAPLTVQFTDTSTGSPTAWAWTFGDGNTSTAQNPQHTYSSAGTYTVTLTATNEYGSDEETKTDYITVYAPVTAQFTADVTSGAAPLTVQFTDLSGGLPTSWHWDFGDGNTSTAQNPQHTYSSTGTYTVTLTASHTYSNDTETKTSYISVVVLQPFPGCSNDPTDPDADGLYEDINGNARWDFQDITLFFQHLVWCEANQPVSLFDWNSNGRCDFDDVFRLWSNGGMI